MKWEERGEECGGRRGERREEGGRGERREEGGGVRRGERRGNDSAHSLLLVSFHIFTFSVNNFP